MLRVTVHESRERVALILEGRLAGPWIREVESAWSAVVEEDNTRPVVVDLSGVTFVDEEGKTLLGRIYEQGADLLADDVMTKALVEELQHGKSLDARELPRIR